MAWREIAGRVCYWFKGETLESCFNMTRKQLLGWYYETFRVEAREQIRLLYANRMGHPQVDAKDYIESLKGQADPHDAEEAEALGIDGFMQAFKMFGQELRQEDLEKDVGQFVKE